MFHPTRIVKDRARMDAAYRRGEPCTSAHTRRASYPCPSTILIVVQATDLLGHEKAFAGTADGAVVRASVEAQTDAAWALAALGLQANTSATVSTMLPRKKNVWKEASESPLHELLHWRGS